MRNNYTRWRIVYGKSLRSHKTQTNRRRQINPTLKMHHTVKSRLPLDSLFNIRAFSSDSTGLPLLTSAPNAHDHDHPHQTKAHYNDITTLHIPLPTLTPSQQEKTEFFLQTLLWESRLPEGKTIEGLDILRTKGYFKVEGGGEYVIQGVTDIFEIKEVGVKAGGEEVQGKLVFIGRGVGQELRTAFDTFVGIS
jgi:G3E family GTPase